MALIHCDRCKKKVEGDEGEHFTAGFYYVDHGYWARYARPFETVVCDECMWDDPAYIADYGDTGQQRLKAKQGGFSAP